MEYLLMISFSSKGDLDIALKYLKKIKDISDRETAIKQYGDQGVEALRSVTPKDTGLTADSWYYEIERDGDKVKIKFKNSNIKNGVPIAIILQYGHATGNGGYVQGRDYINPVIRPIFDAIANEAWKEVTEV